MATRTGSSTGVVVSLVVFVILFIMQVVMTIVFYAGQAKAVQAQQEAEQKLNEFVNRQERNQEWVKTYEGLADQRNVSVVHYISQEHDRSLSMLAGRESTTTDMAAQKVADYGVMDGKSAADVMFDQRRQLSNLNDEVQRKTDQLSTSEQEKAGLFNTLVRTRENHQAELEAATNKIEEYRQANEEIHAQVQTVLDDLARTKDQVTQRYEGQLRDRETEIDRLMRENVVYQSRIKEFESRLAEIRVKPATPESLVDGHIIELAGSKDEVFIDRGRKHRVVLGMTFEVFDAGASISVDSRTGEMARGKASIEITKVGDTTSTCKVTRSVPGRPVVRQDIVANAIYDPEYRFKFLVHGKFDLDGDGRATEAEADYLRAQIIDWGGTVITGGQIPGDLDFLVLGAEPPPPPPLQSNPSEIEIRAYIEQKQAYDTYQRLKNEAAGAQIPWLNSNRLLILIGHTFR